MQEIIIDVSPGGDIKIEGKGIDGADCVKLTQGLEEALGAVETRKLKPEYHRPKTQVLRKAGA